MKFIHPDSNAANNWQNDLLKDLSFIKEKKRYRLSKRTIAPTTAIALFTICILRIVWPFFFVSNSITNDYVFWSTALLFGVMACIIFLRFYSTLKFQTIPTPFHVQDNITTLHKFLTINRLAFTQSADAPEVFLIISRNLNAYQNSEHREVMVFIADDKQILINSHFVGTNKWSVSPPSKNYKSMAKMLRQWLNTHISNADANAVALTHF